MLPEVDDNAWHRMDLRFQGCAPRPRCPDDAQAAAAEAAGEDQLVLGAVPARKGPAKGTALVGLSVETALDEVDQSEQPVLQR